MDDQEQREALSKMLFDLISAPETKVAATELAKKLDAQTNNYSNIVVLMALAMVTGSQVGQMDAVTHETTMKMFVGMTNTVIEALPRLRMEEAKKATTH